MRLLHLHWPHLLLRLARSHSASFPRDPVLGSIVLGGQPWTPGVVLDASPAALAMGIRRGMALGSAHRLAPEATFLDPDPAADRAAVEAALDRLAAFSPSVAGETDPTHPGFGRLEVQLDGLQRLWGPEPVIVERIRAELAPVLSGLPRAGIAGTRFVAMVAAGKANEPAQHPTGLPGLLAVPPGLLAVPPGLLAVPPGEDAAFLVSLPAALLTADPDVRARLARFGLRQIGQVAAVPRSALVARFGAEGERLHARARGEETDPFRPRRSSERMSLALPVEPAVDDLEPLRFLLHRLAATLADQLTARGMATARVHLRLALDRTFAVPDTPSEMAFEQRLPEPTQEAEAIERLLVARLERTPPPAPVARLELELADVAPAAGQQLALFVPQAGRAARLGWQLARLALTFGEDRVRRVELADPEAPLPEARWRWVAVETGATTPS
jgi:nucleotidyltransferase/DNA polymerase involved in DNA repair